MKGFSDFYKNEMNFYAAIHGIKLNNTHTVDPETKARKATEFKHMIEEEQQQGIQSGEELLSKIKAGTYGNNR